MPKGNSLLALDDTTSMPPDWACTKFAESSSSPAKTANNKYLILPNINLSDPPDDRYEVLESNGFGQIL
tara:strand:+ start:468 stop:674 length:207 start_codon:yes stop_codon:yes gene_type:complete